MRPWDDPEEMNEALVDNWNSVVNNEDRVYLCGDVAMRKKHLPIVGRLKGRKVLIKGNHDVEKLSVYTQYFDDIRSYVVRKGLIISHIPVHTSQMESRWLLNAHGHTHSNVVKLPNGEPDDRYYNVCVEKINYTPLDMQVIYDIVHEKAAKREAGYSGQ